MEVRINGDRCELYTPYHKDFVAGIKKIAGRKWDQEKKYWIVNARSLDTVRELMRAVYGENDVYIPEKVTVKVTALKDIYEFHNGIYLYGKQVCTAYNRDGGVRIGPDMELISGKIDSAGSTAYPATYIAAGTVIILHDVVISMLQQTADFYYEIMKPQPDHGEGGKKKRRK